MIRDAWDSVMNAEYNPLRNLPKTYKFQVMTYLSVMWCMIFTVWTGWLMTLGPSIFAHLIILVGIFYTHKIFKDSTKMTHRDQYKDSDGGVDIPSLSAPQQVATPS